MQLARLYMARPPRWCLSSPPFKEDSIGTAPLNLDGSVGTEWQLPTASDQPLLPSQPQVKAPSSLLYGNCPPSSANPPTIYVPDNSTQGNLPPTRNAQACAVAVNSPESPPSDDSAKSDEEADLSADLVSREDTRKRKAPAGGDDGEGKKQPVKRATHNIIEMRYRTNVNEKALRDSLPESRIISMNLREGVAADECDRLHRPVPAHN